MREQLRGLDPRTYLNALLLLVRNPSIVVVPLLMGVIGVFLAQVTGDQSGGLFGGLTGGIASFIVLLLQLFGFGAATIIGDIAWRRGRASFDEGWNDARRKGGDILFAAMGFQFVLYVALYAGSLVGGAGLILVALALFFLVYTIPAAAIGGVPGGAAIQASIERARANPLPTIVVTVVSVLLFLYLPVLLSPVLQLLIAPLAFLSVPLVVALFGALVKSIAIGYIALIVGKTYTDLGFGRR